MTDIDCSYCRRLHKEIPQYLGNGIKVRYIFMPLKGNEDINKTVSVWCADDRKAAIDVAYASGGIEPKECDNPILKHMELARHVILIKELRSNKDMRQMNTKFYLLAMTLIMCLIWK